VTRRDRALANVTVARRAQLDADAAFKQTVLKACERADVTHTEVAKAAGVSRAYVSQLVARGADS
jgi:hypothetical protein